MAMTDKEIADYFARQRRVWIAFDGMARGARQNASYDLRLELTTLGRVIGGSKISPPALALIEKWITLNGDAWKKSIEKWSAMNGDAWRKRE